MVQQKTKSRHDQDGMKKSFNADLQILSEQKKVETVVPSQAEPEESEYERNHNLK